MKSKINNSGKPPCVLLLACAAIACFQNAMANPEKPHEDSRLRPFYASIRNWMKLPTETDWYPRGLPLPDNITEYPDQQEEMRYYYTMIASAIKSMIAIADDKEE